MKTNVFFLLSFLGLAACKNDSKTTTTNSTTASTAPTTSTVAKPECYLYQISVDKLRLRAEPNQQSKVIAQFKDIDFVTGKGEVSSNIDSIMLGDLIYKEPYYKVTSTTPEQQEGWAFGGALRPVYTGTSANSPDLGTLVQFATFLHGLNPKKAESGKAVWGYLEKNFATASGSLADAVFIMAENKMHQIQTSDIYKLVEKVNFTDPDMEGIWKKTFKMNTYPTTKILGESGFYLAQEEGMIFPVIDWKRLEAFFENKVTSPMKNYIMETRIENEDAYMSDGGIVISMEDMTKRALFWEQFNATNPHFPLSEETKMHENNYVLSLLVGANNTPAFEYNETGMGKVDSTFDATWKIILKNHANTNLGKEVKVYTDIIQANGGKSSPKTDAYIKDFSAKNRLW
jgi:hypothetical protein